MVNGPSPAVSVIMNCYNSAKYLAEAIDSVYAQTFTDWEIIFWDNCSTDESPAIARRYDGRLRYFRGENNVPLGHARNLAMAQARGRFIAFLDCDDLWLPKKLEEQVALMEKDPALGLVFSDVLFFSEKGRAFRTFPRRPAPQGRIFGQLLCRYFLPMPAVMIRRTALESSGGNFDERFNMVEDADLFMRIAYHHPVGYVHQVLAKRRMHEQSWTAQKKELFPREEEMLLDKFAARWPSFTKEFSGEIAVMRALVQYQYAVLDWEQGRNAEARRRMSPHLPVLRKMWLPFLFSYGPIGIYKTAKGIYKSIFTLILGGMDDQVF